MGLYLQLYKKEVITLHKMFTLDDLYNFYNSQNKTCVFNSKESNSTIVVQIPETMNFSDDYDPTYNLLPVHLMSCHLLENRNHSSISRKAMNEAIKSFSNRPILGYIQKIDDGDGNYHYDFAGHEMEFDEDGNIEYKEKVVGVIPESCNPKIVHSDEYDKDYLEVDGLIYEDYTHAAEILRDKGRCDVSVEIAVDALSFDAKTKVMHIDQFHFLGVTILGVTTDESHQKIEPGMEGSNITISDFSAENNSVIFSKSELINEITQAVITTLDNHNKTTERRNDEVEFEEKIEETVDEVFDGTSDNISDVEPTEEKVIEVNSDDTTEESPEVVKNESVEDDNEESDEPTEVFVDDEDSSESTDAEDSTDENSTEEDSTEEELVDESTDIDNSDEDTEVAESQDDKGKVLQNELTYSVTIDGVTKTFSVSLVEKLNALSMLVNSTYGETDQTYYDIDAYDDEKVVIMHDYWNNKHYRQSYAVKKDVYSLKGDRVECFARYLTADEISRLDSLKADYAEKSDKLAKYESEPEKMEILNSADYSNIANQDDFIALKQQENHFDLSVEELKAKADAMLLAYAKTGKLNFATIQESQKKEEPKKDFFAFARIEPKTDFLDKVLAEKK